MAKEYDLVIVGGGAAGLTAGMYAARYGLRTVIIEQMIAGNQVINAQKIEDFPGFPQGLSGAELGPLMMEQAIDAGAEMAMQEATVVRLDGNYRIIETTADTYRTKALVIAAGSNRRKLGIDGEDEFLGRGISHCATCDGPLFNGEVVGVVGGGDSAADEALTLTEYAQQVVLFHRSNQFQAQKVLQERLMSHPKLDVSLNTVVESILGDGTVTGVQVRNVVTNLVDRVDLSGLFIYVGLEPNTKFLMDVLKPDKAGHIPVNLWLETAVPGIYAAGDIRQHSAAQLATAAGDGATAAIAAFHYVSGQRWDRR